MTNQLRETSDGVPISDGFDFPVGPRGPDVDVFRTHKVDATLVDPAYFKSFGVWHPGEDWNGRGGGDTDLGDPIYAVSHGKVVEFGYNPTSWGNIVLLEHALPDGTQLWSQYAHLNEIMVNQVGQKVQRGQQIGTLGKGAKTAQYPQGRWVAHLHFELRRKRLPIGNWTPMVQDREQVIANYYYPQPFINARRPNTGMFVQTQTQTQTPVQVAKAPIHIIVDSQYENKETGTFQKAEADMWYTAPYGFYGTMLWTYSAYATESNWGEWRPALPYEGQWQVWAFIPAQYGTTTSARYQIIHMDGRITIGLDQSKYVNKWAYLGTYRFGPGRGYVRLTDITGENGQTPTTIAFDALSWSQSGG